MTIELKNRHSPSPPPAPVAGGAAAPRVEEPRSATNRKPILPSGSQRELTVGEFTATIGYKDPTSKQVAVIYADSRMMTAIIESCLRAEGKDPEVARHHAANAQGATYHGGNPELERAGIKAPAIILPAEYRVEDKKLYGSVIAHEQAHASGGSERRANNAERQYLGRRGVTELPTIDPGIYPQPDRRPKEEGKVISLSIGPVGGAGRGAGYNNRIPPVKRAEQAAKVVPVKAVRRPDSVKLGDIREAPAPRPSQPRSEESVTKLAAELAGAALAAAAAVAAEIGARISRIFGRSPPPSEEKEVDGVSGGVSAGMNPGQHGRGRSQGDQRHGNEAKGEEKRKS